MITSGAWWSYLLSTNISQPPSAPHARLLEEVARVEAARSKELARLMKIVHIVEFERNSSLFEILPSPFWAGHVGSFVGPAVVDHFSEGSRVMNKNKTIPPPWAGHVGSFVGPAVSDPLKIAEVLQRRGGKVRLVL